ncbi:MAG: hypothetical protein J6X18_17085 [Bacteroidales bacterium]|nr:hypothetical protein [Bacteroidales bacterium]
MIHEIKEFFCDRIPTENDIKEVIAIQRKENCIINLTWNGPASGFYGDHTYLMKITSDDNVSSIMKRISNRFYPV